MTNTIIYPTKPTNADPQIIQPSPLFKKSVANVTLALVFFVITYLIILSLGLVLALGVGLLGIALIIGYPSFLTVVLGAGLILSACMLLYFLIKFIFKRQPRDYSGMYEITEDDQPKLFHFIRSLTQESGAPFPKHIFLTADVNAGVFYNSSFWSMFLPVRKNLQIGLGLVNSLNISEFKAVMAHEFGHFSQRSMRFGSYVYNMNKVVHNMLYDNEKYFDSLNRIAKLHGYIRLSMMLNVYIVRGIQDLLKKMYSFLNKRYLGLSREMEFHADTIAAYYSGADHSISALRRIEVSQICYTNLISYLNGLAVDKKRPNNVYPLHLTAMNFFGAAQHLSVDKAGIPLIKEPLFFLNNTQVIINDQWASHPTQKQREKHLMQLKLTSPVSENATWELFDNASQIQIQLTDIIYASANQQLSVISQQEIDRAYHKYNDSQTLNNIYKGYYTGRYITSFNPENIDTPLTYNTVDELLSDTNCNTPLLIEGINSDIQTIEYILTQNEVKTFEYAGIRHSQSEASEVKTILQKKLTETRLKLEYLDKQIFLFYLKNSTYPEKIIFAYNSFFDCQKDTERYFDKYTKMATLISSMYQTMKFEDIEELMVSINTKEKDFKPFLEEFINNELYQLSIRPSQRESIQKYIEKKWIYFSRPVYNDQAIEVLGMALASYKDIVSDYFFAKKKELTQLQLNLAH